MTDYDTQNHEVPEKQNPQEIMTRADAIQYFENAQPMPDSFGFGEAAQEVEEALTPCQLLKKAVVISEKAGIELSELLTSEY